VIKLSIVIPIYNEEQALSACLPKIIAELDFLKFAEFEIVLVDDGSTDRSQEEVRKLSRKYPMIRLIAMPSNQGQIKAIHIGLSEAKGAYIASLDLDLQDPPEHIKPMYEALVQGDYDCVQAVRINRKSEARYKNLTAKIFYLSAPWLTGVKVVPHAGEFRILRKNTVRDLLKAESGVLYLRTAIPAHNIKSLLYPISQGERQAGISHYTFQNMLKLALGFIYSVPRTRMRIGFLVFVALMASIICGFIIEMDLKGFSRSIFLAIGGIWIVLYLCLTTFFVNALFVNLRENTSPFQYKELHLDGVPGD
jgi:dolichol-phosphate mannosyltransferase